MSLEEDTPVAFGSPAPLQGQAVCSVPCLGYCDLLTAYPSSKHGSVFNLAEIDWRRLFFRCKVSSDGSVLVTNGTGST